MASDNENVLLENSGRRTRSGRQVSTSTVAPTAPTRSSMRRTSKRQAQVTEHEDELEANSAQSNLISAMMSEAAQGIVAESIEEVVYCETQIAQPPLDDDIEMSVTATETGGVDEKSSSFPFGTVEHSETSDDAKEITPVESSLLASLAGDNANSLPSVAGNDDQINDVNVKNSDFDASNVVVVVAEHIQENCEKMESSEDSISEPAIAEDLPDADTSNATIVNTEIISEDELPLPSKPEINDAEEVSDEELPAPKRAELPADAEVISEDELPSNNNNNIAGEGVGRHSNKRKAGEQNTSCLPKKSPVNEENKSQSSSSSSSSPSSIKKGSDEQYNPMSPTSESNDEPPIKKKATFDEEIEKNKDKEDKEKDNSKDSKDNEKEKEKERKKLPDLDKYWRAVKDDPADFTGWTYLLQYVDSESDAEAAREAYDTFLALYPYCYGYWRKYADYEKRKGIKTNCYAVFERGLVAIPLSVDLWIHYLTHVKTNHADDEEFIRKQFERAIEACGLEFRSDKLWDTYLRWENEQKRYHNVVQIYDRLLAIPTQSYSTHFDSFQDLINQHPITSTISNEELYRIRKDLFERSSTSSRASSLSKSTKSRHDSSSTATVDKEEDSIGGGCGDGFGAKSPKDTNETHNVDDTTNTTNNELNESEEPAAVSAKVDLSDPNTLITEEDITAVKDKVISIRRKLHKLTIAAVTARWSFEEGIKRPYFHVKPLERTQLKNWKDYLDFEIEKGHRKRILVLFERCLIACALYDEFWLKMLRYLESISDQPDVLEITRDVFKRACQIHHPDKPSLHLMWAAFEECHNNFNGAAEVLDNIEKKVPNLLQIAYRRINVERRCGDLQKCRELYKHYIETAKNKAIAGSLAIKYARFLNKICNDLEGGLQVLQQSLEKDPNNTRVALQMIDLALQRPVVNELEVVEIMDKFMSRESMDPEQKVLFAQRKVEFLEDFGSTARGLQDAQRALQITLSKANEAKKKRESSPSRKATAANKDGGGSGGAVSAASSASAGTGAQTTYNNGSAAATAANANYNYNSVNSSAYYGGQQATGGSTAAAYQQTQQQQQSYDSYYNQWQYNASAGAGGGGGGGGNGSNYNYGQWSGYGNYY